MNGLTLCHKGDNAGVVMATVPDVCKTPSPGGPVPIPYPNIAFARDLAKGSTTVKADGGNMIANKGSEFSKSIGDEPGTVGGVKSGTNMAEATWLAYSMNVFVEGKNACRLTDKMLLNHGNTVSLGGFLTEWLNEAKAGRPDCAALWSEIDRLLNGNKDAGTSTERGLKERWFDQIRGKNGPGTTGKHSWATHEVEILIMAARIQRLLVLYATYCGGGPPPPTGAYEWAYKGAPKPSEWLGPNTAPSSTGFSWGTLGLAVGLTAVTAIAILVPFDGPVGDVAAGTAAAGAWGRLFGTAAAAGL